MSCVFVNGRVLTATGFREDLEVLVEDGLITRVEPDLSAANVSQRIDLAGQYLVPGFIDTQVNGGGDVLFNASPDLQGLAQIARAHRRFGTTSLLPTLISDSPEVRRAALAAVRAALDEGLPGILGIHLEGPWLATAKKGIHEARHFGHPAVAELDELTLPPPGRILLTLAPEQFEVRELQDLVARGIILSAGHTNASFDEMQQAFAAGVRGVTHLFNAMSPLTSREPGVTGAALADTQAWCGLIVDGYHVHDASLRIAIAARPRGRMLLVTDAMPPVGGSSEEFELGGRRMVCRDGRCSAADGTLAGSALDMASAVRNTVQRLGLPLAEACRMASAYPAAFLGLDRQLGHIAPGYRADLVVLNEAIFVTACWQGGVQAD